MFKQCSGNNGGGLYISSTNTNIFKTSFVQCQSKVGFAFDILNAPTGCHIDYLAVVNCECQGNSGVLVQASQFLELKHANTNNIHASNWCPSVDIFNMNAEIKYLHQFNCISDDTVTRVICSFSIFTAGLINNDKQKLVSHVLCHECDASKWADAVNPYSITFENMVFLR